MLFLLLCLASAYDNNAPHSRLPPLGWSSWVALGQGASHPTFDFCDENSVKAAADALVSPELGLFAAGYRHFHLDDCWAGGRNSSGFLYPETDHFPNGMKSVVDYVHSKGLVFGLYTCAGTKTCVGGRPGSKDHWEQDAAVWAEWGVDWVKMDWCNTEGMDPVTTYPKMSHALNKTGRPIHFNMCEWGKEDPWTWGDAVAQSWRATGDHTGTWNSVKSIVSQIAKVPAKNTGRPYGWNDMDMLETGNGERAAHANGKLSNMTADEYKTEFSMWAISASPLVVTTPIMNCSSPKHNVTKCSVELIKKLSHAACTEGTSYGCSLDGTMWTDDGCRGEFKCNSVTVTADDMDAGKHIYGCSSGPATCVPWITPLQHEILKNTEAIAINQDITPQGRPVKDGDLSVWARHLSDGSVAVALYNQDDSEAKMSVDFSSLGWSTATSATIRDLWAHKDLGSHTGSFGPVPVAQHATLLLRLTKH